MNLYILNLVYVLINYLLDGGLMKVMSYIKLYAGKLENEYRRWVRSIAHLSRLFFDFFCCCASRSVAIGAVDVTADVAAVGVTVVDAAAAAAVIYVSIKYN